jgi:hypothetical protein
MSFVLSDRTRTSLLYAFDVSTSRHVQSRQGCWLPESDDGLITCSVKRVYIVLVVCRVITASAGLAGPHRATASAL